jgi:hypothetical protein
MKKQLAWILGGGSVVALGIVGSMSGCSSNPSGGDAGMDATAAETGTDATKPDTGSDAGNMEASTCDVTPKGPFEGDSGPYCPYLADGGSTNCGVGNHCCIPAEGTGPSVCEPGQTACAFADAGAKNADFQCNESGDCMTGQVCCLTAPGTATSQDPGCTSYYYVSAEHGTTCMASCGSQAQICGQDSDCTSGMHCIPLSTLGMWLGVCK